MEERVKLLLTNDDGIFADGILSLRDEFLKIGEVYVVAPDGERSSVSHAITLNHPLRINEVYLKDEFLGYATTGTPVDCVILALNGFLEDKHINYIISGINHGVNLGEDVIYSGTVSAAFEGCMFNISAFAFSKQIIDNSLSFSDAAFLARGIFQFFIKVLDDTRYILNVNFPDIPINEIKGVKIVRLGKRIYNDRLEKRIDPRGRSYYWIGGDAPSGKEEEGTDIDAISRGFISITPLSLDFVNHELLDKLNEKIGSYVSLEEMMRGDEKI